MKRSSTATPRGKDAKKVHRTSLQEREQFLRELRRDPELLLILVDSEFTNDRDCVMTAVSKQASTLQYASDEIQKDKNFVLQATLANRGVFRSV